MGKNGKSQQSRKDDDERHKHLEGGANDWRHFCRSQVFGSKNALHNKEVGCPVAERNDGAETEDDAEPGDAHGIVIGGTQGAPQMRVFGRGVGSNLNFESTPAACFNQSEDWNKKCTSPDQDELQDFVENGGTQASQSHINRDGCRRRSRC